MSMGGPGGAPGTDSYNQSFHPLDVQNPPSFGDVNSSNNTGINLGMGSPNGGVPSFPTGMGSNSGFSGTSDPFGQAGGQFGQPQQFGGPQMMQQQFSASQLPARDMSSDLSKIHPRDIELILSRLELVRSELENVNHRLSYIEQNFSQPQSGKSGAKGAKNNWY